MESRVGQETVAETLILARFRAEEALVDWHENPGPETFKEFQSEMNKLHRLTRTKWTGTNNVKPPTCLFEHVEYGEKRMRTFLDDLSVQDLQLVLDKTGELYEKLNLHGYMKERAGDMGMGGKDAAQKAKEKAEKEA